MVGLRITSTDAPLDRLGEAADPVPRARASLRASTVEWTASVVPRRPDAAVADADTVLMRRHLVPVADDASDYETTRPPTPSSRHRAPSDGPASRSRPRTSGSSAVRRVRSAAATPDRPPRAGRRERRARAVGRRASRHRGRRRRPGAAARPGASPARRPSRRRDRHRRPRGPRGMPRPRRRHSTRSPGVPVFRVGGGPPHPITGRVLIGRRPLAPRIPERRARAASS